MLSTYRFVIQHRAGVKHGNCDGLSTMNRPCMSCTHCKRREEEEKEGQLKETCQCHNLIPENQDISDQNGQREIIQKSSRENESKEVSLAESKKKGGHASKRDPTEWELQKHTDAESIRCLGYLHGGLPSKDVKSGDSMAENPNSSKCENVWAQSE